MYDEANGHFSQIFLNSFKSAMHCCFVVTSVCRYMNDVVTSRVCVSSYAMRSCV